MFELHMNYDGEMAVITDNATLANAIRDEGGKTPVWFTDAPSKEVAESIAEGMSRNFNGNFRAMRNTRTILPRWSVEVIWK